MFGKEARQKYFTTIDKDYIPINHGSYGVTPTMIHEERVKFIEKDISCADKYMFEELPAQYLKNLKAISSVVKCDYRELAIIENATSGVDLCLRSLKWNPGDKILISSIIYGSFHNLVRFLQEMFGVELVMVEIDALNDNHDEIVAKFEAELKRQPIKLCIFDVVSSMPAIRTPFERLTQLCKDYNVISFVDGAHGIGLLPFDLSKLNPDFLVTNLHKWYYAPRGCALLYVNPKWKRTIQTLPISHDYSYDDDPDILIKKFTFYGSKDYSTLSCITKVIEFRQTLGGDEAIWNYFKTLRAQVVSYLEKKGYSFISTGDDSIPMINVILPIDISKVEVLKLADQMKKKSLQNNLYFQIGSIKDTIFLRLSFQVYNEFDDYVKAIDFLETLLENDYIHSKL